MTELVKKFLEENWQLLETDCQEFLAASLDLNYSPSDELYDILQQCGIDFLKDVEDIPDDVFAYNKSLKYIIIPKSVKHIGSTAFKYSNIENVSFEQNSQLEFIGYKAFYECVNIKKIDFPHSLEIIRAGAFQKSDALEQIFLPKNLRLIGVSAFRSCPRLRDIFYEGTKEDWSRIDLINPWGLNTKPTIHCSDGDIQI